MKTSCPHSSAKSNQTRLRNGIHQNYKNTLYAGRCSNQGPKPGFHPVDIGQGNILRREARPHAVPPDEFQARNNTTPNHRQVSSSPTDFTADCLYPVKYAPRLSSKGAFEERAVLLVGSVSTRIISTSRRNRTPSPLSRSRLPGLSGPWSNGHRCSKASRHRRGARLSPYQSPLPTRYTEVWHMCMKVLTTE